ncbi:MAG TPA: fused MFS/spermidine synthase [Marmoricola sp.]|nr:fused MFS/spermidine synthase [Marmoricola sp.]
MPLRHRGLEVVVFVVGAASLGAEIAAARLLAPWFGASTIVWANTIAIVLVALSVGYALGGRAADRRPTLEGLSRIVLAAGVLLAAVPFAGDPFLHASVTAFAHLSVGIFLGSLVGVGALVAVPVLLLGMVSPYAVRLSVHRVGETGRTTGRLYAISTVGSLAGTFLAALLLIPVVGTRRTFLVFALSLTLAAIPGLVRGRVPALAAPLAIVVLIALPEGIVKSAGAEGRVVWEKQTEYQYARVVQAADDERTLELNEGQAIHSIYEPGRYLVGGYWDEMLVAPFAGAHPPRSVAILGSAAGTTARALGHYFPGVRVDAVELDPAITAVGRQLFDLRGPRLHTWTADARPWLETTSRRYDAILVDAYRQPYIPFYLATEQFFALARQHLRPGGVLAVNVGHPPQSDALEKVLSATVRAAFGADRVWRDPVDDTNTVLLATTGRTDPSTALQEASLPPDVARVADATAARLAPALRGGTVYTDDRAPVEWLVDLSLAQVAETHHR